MLRFSLLVMLAYGGTVQNSCGVCAIIPGISAARPKSFLYSPPSCPTRGALRNVTSSLHPGARDSTQRANHLAPQALICPLCPASSEKIFCFSEIEITAIFIAVLSHYEGRWPTSLTRGRMRWTRMALKTRASEADGEVV